MKFYHLILNKVVGKAQTECYNQYYIEFLKSVTGDFTSFDCRAMT